MNNVYKDFHMVDRTPFILEYAAGKSVLHLGCTNYPYTQDALDNDMLLHARLSEVAEDLVGIDSDQLGIDELNKVGFTEIYNGDLEHLESLDLDRTFDVIIAGEMIEHLNNPGSFLNGIKRFMSPTTVLLITTINAYCGMRFFYYGIRGKKGKAEPVHPDHVAYYSYSTLTVLIERHGLHVQNFLFYDLGKEHRPHNPWFLNLANDISVKIAPQWADGLIAVCKIDT